MCSACQSIRCCVGAHTRSCIYTSYTYMCFFFSWSVCEWASECVSGDGRLSRSPPSSPEIFTPVRHESLHVLSHTYSRHSHWQMASPTHTNTPIPTQKQHIHALFNIFIWCYMKWRLFAYGIFFFLLLMRKNGFKKQAQMHNFLILPPSLSAHFPHIPSCLLSPFQPNSSPHCSPRAHSICGHFC